MFVYEREGETTGVRKRREGKGVNERIEEKKGQGELSGYLPA